MTINSRQIDLMRRMTNPPGVPVVKVKMPEDFPTVGMQRIRCESVYDLEVLLMNFHRAELIWLEDGALMCSCTIEKVFSGGFVITNASVTCGIDTLVQFTYAFVELESLVLPEVFVTRAENQREAARLCGQHSQVTI